MEAYLSLIVVAAIYLVLLFFDTFFKTCAHYPYHRFLEGTGLEIKPFYIKWCTKAFNRILIRWSNYNSRFFNIWFKIGLFASLFLFPIGITLLAIAFFQNLFKSNDADSVVIETIIPGVNLPLSELGYYSLTLVICSVVHEAGHALAAVNENVNLESVGLNILFVLPVAYVNLSNDRLFSINRLKTLRILCAGIWHNIVLSLLGYIIYLSLPSIFSLFYTVNHGVTVNYISQNSPLLGIKGVKVGDVITNINDCNVFDEDSYVNCLKLVHTKKSAFCLNSDLIHDLDESVPLHHTNNGYMDCCGSKKTNNFCFEYMDSSDGILELPSHVCLPGRSVVENSNHLCSFEPYKCPNDLYCFRPLLENNTNLFKIIKNDKTMVIYSGPISDLYATISISPYIPNKLFGSTKFPDVTIKFFKYIVLFSMGFALINIIPCLFMDGQYITNVMFQLLFVEICGLDTTNFLSLILTYFFTLVLVIHCLLSTYKTI